MATFSDAAEAVVVALAASGNASAFDELVRRKQSSVRALLRNLSRDAGIADDLAQHVFLEMWRSLPRLSAAGAFGTWLRRIAVNVWLQHARKGDSSLRRLSDSFDEGASTSSETPAHGREIDLIAALGQLPAPVRLCIVLAYQEGLSHADIAALTGIPLGTIKSHISRGSARLRELLHDYGADA
jgi:RNA polymerase sigma-70 factor, ECF subfamily